MDELRIAIDGCRDAFVPRARWVLETIAEALGRRAVIVEAAAGADIVYAPEPPETQAVTVHAAQKRTVVDVAPWQDALEALIQMSRQKRIAIMCAEAVPWRCHRSLVADALGVRGVPVIEILSESSYRMHQLTPFAQVEGVRITYPPQQAALL